MAKYDQNFWIGVISQEHAQLGVKGGFIQLNHGKKTPLQRLHAGDGIIIYSPRTACPDGGILQHFTAIGTITTGNIYQVKMTQDFTTYRVDVNYIKCYETPIKPLIVRLSFIKNKDRWGTGFRFGYLKIPFEDFKIISKAMGAEKAIMEEYSP